MGPDTKHWQNIGFGPTMVGPTILSHLLIQASRSSIGWPRRPIILLLSFLFLFFAQLIDENQPIRRPPLLHQQRRHRPCSYNIQTSDPCCPRFLQGAKCAKFRPQSSSNRRIFEPGRFIGKQKQTCQGSMIGLPSYQNWVRQVPPTPRTVGAMGTSGKFLIYPPFQWPRPSTAPPMLYHLLGLYLL